MHAKPPARATDYLADFVTFPAPQFQQVREMSRADGVLASADRPGTYAGGGVKTPKWLPAGSFRSAKTSPSLLVVGGTSTVPPSRSTLAQTAATSWTTTRKMAWFGNSPPVSKIPPLGVSAPGSLTRWYLPSLFGSSAY